jgi:hypothetical protein
VIRLPRPRSQRLGPEGLGFFVRVAAFPMDNADLAKSLQDKQREMSRFRQMIAHLAESGDSASFAAAPLRR